MKRDEFNYTLLRERLIVLKFFKSTKKRVIKEIEYIENLLVSEVFSEERKGMYYER